MDGRRYDSMDGGGRIAPGAAIENNAGAIAENAQSDRPERLLETIPGFHLAGALRATNFVPDKIVDLPSSGVQNSYSVK